MPSPWYCWMDGVEIAQRLLRQMKTVGTDSVAAKFIPAWKSPSLADPSPK